MEQCHKLDEAGITYRFIYLAGLAGQNKCVESAKKSAAVFNQVNPTHIILTSLTLMPGTELFIKNQEGKFNEVSELERLQEIRALISDLDGELEILGQHVSNSVPFDAVLPADKERVVRLLEIAIGNYDESVLRNRRDRLKMI